MEHSINYISLDYPDVFISIGILVHMVETEGVHQLVYNSFNSCAEAPSNHKLDLAVATVPDGRMANFRLRQVNLNK